MFGTKILEERKSKYNGILRVVKSWGLGTYIQSDGLTQSGGIVETMWKGTLKKIYNKRPPSVSQFKINNCLILGLGGGTVAKLVRKNWAEAKITGVDIDPIIVELGQKYLGLEELGVKVFINDAFRYTKYDIQHTKYDLIIVDLYNGDEFPKKFKSENYIQFVRSHLANNGFAIFNRLYYKDKKIMAEEFGEKLKKVFGRVERFRPVTNLMYICSK
jgi:spermidine synthase